MLAAMLIVFREMIKAGLIVGIVLAASRGVPRRGRMVALGVVGGVAGACVVAAFAGRIAGLFAGSGQELFDTAVLLAAIAMLTWHNVWMAGHGRSIAQDMRRLGTAVSEGRRPLAALGIVVGIAVLREGAEAVLFLYGIATSGGTSIPGMMLGGALGVAGGAAMAALIYAGLLAIPAGRLLAVTGWLITLLAAGMASQAIAFLQQAGYAQAWSTPLWDTSWLLRDASLAGRLLHTLIGYTAQPDAAQLAAYLATIVMITALARAVRPPRRTAPAAAG